MNGIILLISKMGLDKFGRAASSSSSSSHSENKLMRNSPVSFTTDSNIDCENRRLCNVKAPQLHVDATNKKYVDERISKELQNLKTDFQTAFNDYARNMTTSFHNQLSQHEKLLDDMKQMWNVRFEELVEKSNKLETVHRNATDDMRKLQKDTEKMTGLFRDHLAQHEKTLDGIKHKWNVRFEELVQKVNTIYDIRKNTTTDDMKHIKNITLK